MMKKIIAGISALALSLTAFSSMVYAADYEVSLGSGTTSTALEEGIAFISVYSEGLSSAICASGKIAISVPTGTLSTEEGYIMTSEKMGLSKKVGMKTYYPEFQCAVNADGSSGDVMYGTAGDGFDTVVVSWAGAYAFAADANDLLCELMVVPTGAADIDMKLIEVGLDIYEDSSLQGYTTSVAGKDTQYVLAAGTSTVTAKSTATATPTVDPAAATVSELQESDADDKNAANLDYAKAIYKSFAGSELVGKRVAWTINGKTAAFDYAIADVDGDVVVGLVIMDTVADALNAITAATAAIVD